MADTEEPKRAADGEFEAGKEGKEGEKKETGHSESAEEKKKREDDDRARAPEHKH